MRQSQLFTKTKKEAPKDETSKNAQLLVRGGFVHKEMAGVYSYLPLGFRVLTKIQEIIREELNKIGSQEMVMTALQQKDIWEKSNRWNDEVVDDWFKTELKNKTELGLAFTHEEPLTAIMIDHVSSYKDLPIYAYQFQTKFRNELRAKSGIMRGREFLMKDLYDFSTSKEEHDAFYEKMKGVYMDIFKRVGIGEQTYLTLSSGGSFSKYSYEFQTISDAGEDTILYNKDKGISINKDDFSEELLSDFGIDKDVVFEEARSIEVGDIYSLGEKYSQALGLTYKDSNGKEQYVYMGSYGIGVSRLMGAIVEVLADEKGCVWPYEIAPFHVHVVTLGDDKDVIEEAIELKEKLESKSIEVLWDDRNCGPGEKFADADLIGIPLRIVISRKTQEKGVYEIKSRKQQETVYMTKEAFLNTDIEELIV